MLTPQAIEALADLLQRGALLRIYSPAEIAWIQLIINALLADAREHEQQTAQATQQ